MEGNFEKNQAVKTAEKKKSEGNDPNFFEKKVQRWEEYFARKRKLERELPLLSGKSRELAELELAIIDKEKYAYLSDLREVILSLDDEKHILDLPQAKDFFFSNLRKGGWIFSLIARV